MPRGASPADKFPGHSTHGLLRSHRLNVIAVARNRSGTARKSRNLILLFPHRN